MIRAVRVSGDRLLAITFWKYIIRSWSKQCLKVKLGFENAADWWAVTRCKFLCKTKEISKWDACNITRTLQEDCISKAEVSGLHKVFKVGSEDIDHKEHAGCPVNLQTSNNAPLDYNSRMGFEETHPSPHFKDFGTCTEKNIWFMASRINFVAPEKTVPCHPYRF